VKAHGIVARGEAPMAAMKYLNLSVISGSGEKYAKY